MRAAPDVTPTPSDQDQAQWGMETMAAQTAATATAAAGTPEPTEPPPTTIPEPTETPTEEPAETPTQATTPAPTPAPTQPPAAQQPSGAQVHIVQSGENLYRIALQYGMSYPDLAAYNNIVNPHSIRVGQEIRIPPSGGTVPSPQPQPSDGTVHIVQPGENLFRIALRYNMSYHYLASYNNISNPNSIYVGQRIRIP
jgi:LysM repeat protein